MSAPPRRPASGVVAAAVLAVLVLATFASSLPASRALYERDVHAYWYPQRAALRAAVAGGSLPLWNPWVGFGAPFLADASAQLAYPPTWLLLPLPPALQFELFAIGHCLLAAAGAAALAHRLFGGVLPATVAGAGYALAGPLLSALGLYHHFAGAALMPWVLWALEGLLRRPGRGPLRPQGQRPWARPALVLGVLSAAQILAGSGDLVLMTGLVGLARGLLELARRPGRTALRAQAAGLAVAAALSLGIGAVQWLPTVERAVHGLRAGQDLRTRSYWSLHPSSLPDLAVPRLVSDAPLSAGERERLFEGREPLLACIYVGVVTLALAALALVLRDARAGPLAAGLVVLLTLSLGRHTPVYAWLLELPGFGLLRYPQKYLLPWSLCLALLAAAGAAAFGRAWTDSERRRARALAVGLLVTAVALAAGASRLPPEQAGAPVAALKLARSGLLLALVAFLFWRRGADATARPAVTGALLLLGGLDLVVVGRGTNPTAPAALYEHRPGVLDRLAATGRIHAATESSACLAPGAGPPGWERPALAALGFLDTLRPPSAIRWGLRGSYDGEFTGLGPRFVAPLAEVVHAGLGTAGGLRLLQLGGVERVLLVGRSAPPGLERLETRETPLACPLQLLRVPDSLPEAFVVGRERLETGDPLAALLDPAFDPRREALVDAAAASGEAQAAGAAGAAGGADAGAAPAGAARVVARSPDSVAIEAELAAPGLLVLLDAHDEGWRVEVDGQPAALVRANGAFRGVRLAAGHRRVRFAYRPLAVVAGTAIGGLGLAAAVALAAAARRHARD